MLSDEDVSARALELSRWIREGRNFPNDYRNIEMISHLGSELVGDLIEERERLKQRIDELQARLRRHSTAQSRMTPPFTRP